MSPSPPTDPQDDTQREMSASVNALSRALAVVVLMLLPAGLGYWLDQWMGTQWIILVGFLVGTVFAAVGLIYVTRAADYDLKHKSKKPE